MHLQQNLTRGNDFEDYVATTNSTGTQRQITNLIGTC